MRQADIYIARIQRALALKNIGGQIADIKESRLKQNSTGGTLLTVVISCHSA
jgi:hypothetical protein